MLEFSADGLKKPSSKILLAETKVWPSRRDWTGVMISVEKEKKIKKQKERKTEDETA